PPASMHPCSLHDALPIWTTGAELGQQVSREMQAERLLRAELTSLDYGVQKYFWYDLTDDSTDPNNHEGNFGMFEQRRSGVAAQPDRKSTRLNSSHVKISY